MVCPVAEARARVEDALIVINVGEDSGDPRNDVLDIIMGSGWGGRSEFLELLKLRKIISRGLCNEMHQEDSLASCIE